jgi:5-methylcytosine-specific restriction endonuclease McrA
MKNKKPNAEHLWKQLDDLVVPRLRLSVTERAVYSYLLRHSRLEGRPRLRFSIPWLARGVRLCPMTARCTLRRLLDLRVLRLVERNQVGHVVVVRLPQEIRAIRPYITAARGAARLPLAASIADADFFKNKALRQAIHSRERSLCFYCLRSLTVLVRTIDHVVPQAQSGRNSYRNLVSCCRDCNSKKGQTPAEDFLRWLYRHRRLTDAELTARLRALDTLTSGKLPPPLPCLTRRQAAPANSPHRPLAESVAHACN